MAFEELGTTPTLLAAEAWKISSRFYKCSLLSYLDRPNNGELALLMDGAGPQDFSGEDGSIPGRPGDNGDGSGMRREGLGSAEGSSRVGGLQLPALNHETLHLTWWQRLNPSARPPWNLAGPQVGSELHDPRQRTP